MWPIPMMPSRLPQMRCPSIQVGDQPTQALAESLSSAVPSASRRGTARISAMVISAVSSVSTSGVLVTIMPRTRAVSRSTLSTPVPKLAISLSCGPAWEIKDRSIRSVTVGTRTCAVLTASASSACVMGLSSRLRRASNSSRMRVSTTSGSLRVTMTSGLLIALGLRGSRGYGLVRHPGGKRLALYYQIPWSGQGGPTPGPAPCRKGLDRRHKIVLCRGMSREGLTHLRMGRTQGLAGMAFVVLAWCAVSGLAAQPVPEPQGVGASGLALPRVASLKSDRVNLRQGPGTDYPTAWVFRRAGLPVEIVKEFESWRQVRDAEGTTGWVLGSMLSGRRTAVVLPWEQKAGQPQPASAALRDDDSASARPLAYVEAGVLASIISCDGRWCRISVGGFRGYIEQVKLWGAYQGEVIR